MDRFQSRGRIVAGIAFDIPGMGYKNPETGKIEGFEPDIARAIAGVLPGAEDEVEFAQVKNERRIPALQDGRVDMVVCQLTITPDRLEQVDFSIPYYVAREGILVRKGSGIRKFDDLIGKRIAVTPASISIRRIRAAFPDAPLVVCALNAGLLEAVEKGEADAASSDLINLMLMRKYAAHPEQFDIIDIGDRFPEKPYGVAVKKGQWAFVAALNGAIESLKQHGEIDRLLHRNID